MRVIEAQDIEAALAGLASLVDVIDRIDQKAGYTFGDVPGRHRLGDGVAGAEEKPATLTRAGVACVGDDRVKRRTLNSQFPNCKL